jgi:hypothetical protein
VKEPDFDKLAALSAELDALYEDGKLDRKAFERVLTEADKACNGHPLTEGIVMKGIMYGVAE